MEEIAKGHEAPSAWRAAMGLVAAHAGRRRVHAAQVVVLVPFVHLIPQARRAWAEAAPGRVFVPRLETTATWALGAGGFEPGAHDLARDTARDLPLAASLLASAGLPAGGDGMALALVQAAATLADVAAAVVPGQRVEWGQRLAAPLVAGLDAPLLRWEAALARLALAWAASSSYATDALFAQRPALLAVVEVRGFRVDPLARALLRHFSNTAIHITLEFSSPPGTHFLHAAAGAEDEAQRAAACVLECLARGQAPVALIAQDRVLTRRVRAMLGGSGLAIRDETGWRLSTTRAGAAIGAMLKAAAWDASTDDVLDWLKNAPAFDAQAVSQAEIRWREAGWRQWRQVPAADAMKSQVQPLRERMRRARALRQWLHDLRGLLRECGQWDGLTSDAAGQTALRALRLYEGMEQEFAALEAHLPPAAFGQWLREALEASHFTPEQEADAADPRVLILPLAQLMGRPVGAVVFAGCDEERLPASPEPPGPWTRTQRELLGLPSREELAASHQAAWRYALQMPHVDLLWRTAQGDEHLMPSMLVQMLQARGARSDGTADPRPARHVARAPTTPPAPSGAALPMTHLSASAYEDLRRCPYRYFALRLLRLQEAEELDSEPGKREFGNWVHAVLKRFHESLHDDPVADEAARVRRMDAAAAQAMEALSLTQSDFLPYRAAWPRVRDGYLQWLAAHERAGASFVAAESAHEQPLEAVTLHGRIDRVDRVADGSLMVIDYKTESLERTRDRKRRPLEDTQLAFYAALLREDVSAAGYLNLGETDLARLVPQEDIANLRGELLQGIASDMRRIAAGAPLPALGQGTACEYCQARGLCRRDFFDASSGSAGGGTA